MTLGQGNLLYNRYRVLEILGRGGMGAVYRATDESLGVDVAVKENLFTTDDYARQFRMEAVILAGLRHPNLPRVTDHFVIDDLGQYLVMDYIEGDDLRQRMEKDGPLSEEEAIRIGTAACDALSFLHSRKPPILHRDIKLGNIKLSNDGNVYLVDFGLAKMAWEHEETMTGARAMTPGYSPPEQYGSARTDARSDIYSLGATLYAAMTGVIPEDSLMRAVDGLSLTPLREHRPEITPRLAAVIEKAMEVIPSNRYQTAEEFKCALLNLTETEIVTEPEENPVPEMLPPIPSEAMATPKKVFWLGRIFVALFALFVILGGAIWSYPPYRELVLAQFFPVPAAVIPSPSTPTLTPSKAPTNTSTALIPSPKPSATQVPFTATTAPTEPLPTALPSTETLAPVAIATETTLPATEAIIAPQSTQQGGGTGEIAFASSHDNAIQIFVSKADGTDLRQLTNNINGACNFDWSPDGKQIVFVSPCLEKSSQYSGSGLYVLDVETGETSALFSGPKGNFEPAWSPDGTKIAYTSMRDGSMQIYVYDRNTSTSARLTVPGNNTQSRYPAWSPDGTKIVYTARRFGLFQIWLMNADGSVQHQIVRSGGTISDYLPAWSPDGKYLLYSETSPNLTSLSTLVKFTLDEEQARNVKIEVPVVDVAFSPDGQWIAYEKSDSINQSVFIYPMVGGVAEQKLAISLSNSFDPVWRPKK